jgi:hypothetical protein
MLYNQKWERKSDTKPNALSLAGLIQWLESQDSRTEYTYSSLNDCLLARYFRASGYRLASVGIGNFSYSWCFLPPSFSARYPHIMDDVAVGQPRTYGDALARARARLKQDQS